MIFLVIVTCMAVQWFLNFSSSPYTFHWAKGYSQWMTRKFLSVTSDDGILAVLLLVLPVVIVVSLIFTTVYHLLGHAGYLILSLLLLWYCMDVTVLRKTTLISADLLISSYQKIFAPLLWFFVLGPVGLTLYIVVATLRAELTAQKYLARTLGALDWVPIRVLGLTFALAGNFNAVFKVWMKELFQEISDNQNQVITLGESALAIDSDVLSLLHRALLIWLVIMALITLGSWIG